MIFDGSFWFSLGATLLALSLIRDIWLNSAGLFFTSPRILSFSLLTLEVAVIKLFVPTTFSIRLSAMAIGMVVFLLFCCVKHVIDRKAERKEEEEAKALYQQNRKVVLGNIDKEKLVELLKDCEEKGIDARELRCHEGCKFADSRYEECLEEMLSEEEREDDEFSSLFFALWGGKLNKCRVFNCQVEFDTRCAWCEQDTVAGSSSERVCLLSKMKENDGLRLFVEEMRRTMYE